MGVGVIATMLQVTVLAAAISVLVLMAIGARWRRTGMPAAGGYALALALGAFLAAEPLADGSDAQRLVACVAVFASVLACARLRPDWNPAGQAFLGTLTLACGAFIVYAATYTFSEPVSLPVAFAGVVLLVLESFTLALLLVGTHEVLDVVARVRWWRRTDGAQLPARAPFVSIHVPTHNEPPELVLETLRRLRHLDYPAYEVVVLDNNTDDPALWRPVAEYCAEVGLRFVHLQHWPGFKAGALNHGLAICDERTELIAVVDADFVVDRGFLAQTVGYFEDPRNGIVQTAQGFRHELDTGYLRRLALTYRSFDEVTMPSRNERDAIIFAGTMGLIRRSALVEAGGWSEWCVTEDAELSLRILARGYSSVYVEREFGRGVMPLTFGALKSQRFRWCLGGVQLLRRHWRLLATGRDTAADGTPLRLTPGQRYDYLTAGLQWFQALLIVTFTALLVLGVASTALGREVAIRPLAGYFVTVPVMLLMLGLTKSFWGLRARLGLGLPDALGAFALFVALTWAVALGCVQGLTGRRAAFLRTPKFSEREALRHALRASRVETALAAFSMAAVAVAMATRDAADAVFLAVLCGWSALVFASAPMAAWWASQADVPTGALRHRRALETAARRLLFSKRPASFYPGVGAVVLLLLIPASLAVGPGSQGLSGILRPGSEAEPAGEGSSASHRASGPRGRGGESSGGAPTLSGAGAATLLADRTTALSGRRGEHSTPEPDGRGRLPRRARDPGRPVHSPGTGPDGPALAAPGSADRSDIPESEPPDRPQPPSAPNTATPDRRPTPTSTPQPTTTPTPPPRTIPGPAATPTPPPDPGPASTPAPPPGRGPSTTPASGTPSSPSPTAMPTPPPHPGPSRTPDRPG